MAHYGAEVAGLSGTDLEKYVEGLCKFVPTEYESECEAVVATAGTNLAACVTKQQKFDATACCADVDLCPAM